MATRSANSSAPKTAAARRRIADATYARLKGKPAGVGPKSTKAKTPGLPKTPTGLPIEAEIQGVMRDFAFGDVWSRPGLPLQTRSLVTLGLLTGLYRTDQLRIHVNIALNLSVTPEQILEVMLHAAAYAGLPTGANASTVAHEVFRKRGIIKE